ncbi:MAG TPA: alpha/beta hydrolase [Gammaproteobacteria bacterium]
MSITLAMLALASASAPVFEDCRIGDPAAGPRIAAECTTLTVPENPAKPDGRQIELRIARLGAMTGEPQPNPLVFLAGGPGQSAIESFPGVAPAFGEVRRHRDILLVDQRGTGGSNPLECAELEEPASESLEVDLDKAKQAAAECVASLDADVRYYTTLDAVRDLEAVRAALGEQAFALYGISYGTRVALEYLRRHPEHVEAVILDGVTVPGEALGPEIATDAQRALELMFDRCAESETCSKHFPDLQEQFDALRARLERAPLTVNVRDPFTGKRTEVTLSWPRAAMLLRMYSYAPESVALLPLMLQLAASGDWKAFAGNLLAMERQAEKLLYIGMHNSVVCSEDAPFFPAAAPETGTADTPYLGTMTTDLIRAMCTVWPTRELPDDFPTPVISDKPVLLLSGEADPVTPPENAAEVASHLSNSRHLVAPGQGHGIAWRGCAPELMAEFLQEKDPAALDAECLQALEAAPFFIDRNGPTP